jgi:hypothetical protein
LFADCFFEFCIVCKTNPIEHYEEVNDIDVLNPIINPPEPSAPSPRRDVAGVAGAMLPLSSGFAAVAARATRTRTVARSSCYENEKQWREQQRHESA